LDIEANGLSVEECYRLLTGVVVPRPIAWVTSLSEAGVVNLAPFSHFTFVAAKPPMLAISVGRKAGNMKDTAANILSTKEFVVNIASFDLVAEVHSSAIEYPSDVSEVDILKLETRPSLAVKPPGIVRCPVQMECVLHQCIDIGPRKTQLIIGEVLHFRIREGLMRDGKIDTMELQPLARLGGPNYATLSDVVTMANIDRTAKA
jgi:flavin reductase (DIM6/NTAB) family NADH-FMN oxidoreductase RutF